MKKPIQHLFWPCIVMMFGVLYWLSYVVLELDSQRNYEIGQNNVDGQARLALWRMDTRLSNFLFAENKRAPKDFFELTLDAAPEFVFSYFQVNPDGKVTLPRFPDASKRPDMLLLQNRILPQALQLTGYNNLPGMLGHVNNPDTPAITVWTDVIDSQAEPPLAAKRTEKMTDNLSQQVEVIKDNTDQTNVQQATQDYMARKDLNFANKLISKSQSGNEEAPPAEEKLKSIPKQSESSREPQLMGGKTIELKLERADSVIRGGTVNFEKTRRAKLVIGPIARNGMGPSFDRHDVAGAVLDALAPDLNGSLEEGGTIPDPFICLDEDKSPAHSFGIQKGDLLNDNGELKRSVQEKAFNLRNNPLYISTFTPYWVEDELVFVRTVGTRHQTFVQGIWVDWKKLSAFLLESASDILPNATLSPFKEKADPQNVTRLLAGAPLILAPGDVDFTLEKNKFSTLKLSLTMAWIFALIAVVGVSCLLIGMLRLNERRTTFVSAVTHELRTPLTTFNLYTEMLMHGMVPEQKLKSYFSTLQQEASRLTHLVDNVLSFSRIERSNSKNGYKLVDGKKIEESIKSCISPILERAGMHLDFQATKGAQKVTLVTNIAAVEQIMVNLADNTAKYSGELAPKVEIDMDIVGRSLRITFKDYGRGISSTMKMRLFVPFSRSAEDAAGDKPGIGLGLALSREIARKLGGDLKYDKTHISGTCFQLYLPLKRS